MSRPWLAGPLAVLCVLAAGGAHAADRPPAAYDKDGDGKFDRDEITVYGLHQVDPILARYDADLSGTLEPAELAKIGRDYAARPLPTKPADLALIAGLQEEVAHSNGIVVARFDPSKPVKESLCPGQRKVYVRRDRLDMSAYTGEVSQKEAKGASLSLLDDDEGGLQSAEAHGVVSLITTSACRHRPEGLAIGEAFLASHNTAVWAQADGVRTDDDPDKDKSTVKLGADLQWGVFDGPWFDMQYVAVSPYYQTDFRGDAGAYGAQLSWQPVRLDSRLGGSYLPAADGFDYFWQTRLEADWLHVEDPGRTGLKAGTDYAWIGGSVGVTVFPGDQALDSRLKAYGTWTYHRDVNNSRDARLYLVGAAYDLTADGAVSVSLDRTWGLERDKLKKVEKTLFSLNFKR